MPAHSKKLVTTKVKPPAKRQENAQPSTAKGSATKVAPSKTLPAARKPAAKKGLPAKPSPARTKTAGAVSVRLMQLTQLGKPAEAGFEAYALPAKAQGRRASLPTLEGLHALSQDATLQAAALWGLMPGDFSARTGLTAAELRAAIDANPGYDLYYCSAHPEIEAVHHNAWRAPEVTHPGFVDLCRALLKAAGLSDKPLDAISHSCLFATGNLMVATPAVWAQYLAFVDRVFNEALPNLDKATEAAIFRETPAEGRLSVLALIVARMPGLFLMLKQARFKAFKIPLPKHEKTLNPHLRFLREIKDQSLEQGSPWLATLWVNYRGLYLAHVMGKAWILKNLKGITPGTLNTALPVAQVRSPYPRTIEVGGAA
jgi:hypothetical protein